MSSLKYRVTPLRVIGSTAFAEASKEELRVLIALTELSGNISSVASLAEAAVCSPARCRAALAFWEESGVISTDDGEPKIIDEFEDRLTRGEIDEVPAVKVADSIRDDHLASMIDECARLMNQACLSNSDVKNLTALHTQYALGPEFIVALAAHLVGKGELTVRRLINEAIKLQGKGIDSLEALDEYIIEVERTSGAEWEFRRVLGIYGRNLSASERGYFKRWSEELGYSVGIVSEAYDIAVLNTKHGDLRYMDKILTAWHEAGCKTVSECRQKIEEEKTKRQADGRAKGGKARPKAAPETPRYGNFDINEAFNNAVARSFTDDKDEGGDK